MPSLLENGSATGKWVKWGGGQGLFMAECSNWNGATVKLQAKSPQGTALDVGAETEVTANGMGRFFLPPIDLRAHVSGSPTGANVWVTGFGV